LQYSRQTKFLKYSRKNKYDFYEILQTIETFEDILNKIVYWRVLCGNNYDNIDFCNLCVVNIFNYIILR